MAGEDLRVAGEIGDGAGDLEQAGVGAGRQAEALGDLLEQLPAGGVGLAEALQLFRPHPGIAVDPLAGKTLLLTVVNYASILLASVIFILVYGKFQRVVNSSRMAALAGKVA